MLRLSKPKLQFSSFSSSFLRHHQFTTSTTPPPRFKFLRLFSGGIIFGSLLHYYYTNHFCPQQQDPFNNNNINDFVAFAASSGINIPIGDGSGNNNNNNRNSSSAAGWNDSSSSSSKKQQTIRMSQDDDGVTSYLFVNKKLPPLSELTSDKTKMSDINTPSSKTGVTPLMVAAFLGDINSCQQLLSSPSSQSSPTAKSNQKDTSSTTTSSLVAATVVADPEVRSTTPTDRDLAKQYFAGRFVLPEGFTALEAAVLGGNEACIALVAEHMTNEIAGGREAERMAKIAAEKGGFDQTSLMQALTLGRQLRKDRLRRRRAQFPLELRIAEKVVGQKKAIHEIASAVRRKENGWHNEDSPLVILSLGSSGVGKTETAKLIADYLVEGKENGGVAPNNHEEEEDESDAVEEARGLPPPFNQIMMQQIQQRQKEKQKRDAAKQQNNKNKKSTNDCFIRLDMSEYQTKHEATKLYGAGPSYVGYGEDNNLARKLAKCPSAVVLFDEIEKANNDLLTVLLQLFDEGRITDGTGKTVDCRDATFIMTSNLAQREIADEAIRLRMEGGGSTTTSTASSSKTEQQEIQHELSRDFKRNVIHPILRRHFGRDEFIGRINEIVLFLPFTESEQEQLTEKQMQLWAGRAHSKHNIDLRFSHGVTKEVTKEYDMRYGARSLQFALDRMAISPIAKEHEMGNIRPNTVVALRTKHEDPLPDFLDTVAAANQQQKIETYNCGNGFVMDVADLPHDDFANKKNNNNNNNHTGYFSKWFN